MSSNGHGSQNGVEKLVIIGSGPAGWTCAIYAARANLQPLVFEGMPSQQLLPGGQLMFTTEVENYPGFPHGVQGPEMMAKFKEQAERFKTRIVTDDIVEVDFRNRPFTLKSGPLSCEPRPGPPPAAREAGRSRTGREASRHERAGEPAGHEKETGTGHVTRALAEAVLR